MASFKEKIKSNFLGKYLISILHCIECKCMPALISDEKAVKKYYKNCTGKALNLDNPQTFCEKLNWYKLYGKHPLMQKCADKIAVREYVKEKGYGECLNEVYGIYNNVKEINLDDLPKRFVLKAAHGSHMNVIVKDKSKINWRREKMMMRTWLHQDIAWSGREWVYKDIPKRLMAEKYLEDESGELRDYKFFCFNGKPEFVQIDFGRFSGNQCRNYYDMNFELMPFFDSEKFPHYHPDEKPISVDNFELMKRMAKDLAEPFQQVRVDLYLLHDKIYFGEMTFFDGGGSTVFEPDEYNYIVGKDWIPKYE